MEGRGGGEGGAWEARSVGFLPDADRKISLDRLTKL